MAEPNERKEQWGAVLFADICGSTPLFEDTGDWMALSVIDKTLDAHAAIAEREGGIVVRSKGDDLLCTFTEAEYAAVAARSMLNFSRSDGAPVRIGLHCGTFIGARGDIFGDAVNLTARLMQLATPREALFSDDIHRRLCEEWDEELLPFDEHHLRGRSESTRLFRLVPPGENSTNMFFDPPADDPAEDEPLELHLTFAGQEMVIGNNASPLKIGRGDGADIQLHDGRASRAHALITVESGRAFLKDRSTYGTWVELNNDVVRIRREALRLVGEGSIWFGVNPDSEEQVPLQFNVVHRPAAA